MLLIPCSIQTLPEGDDKSFMEWLYREYCRLMYATAWKITRKPEDVCDIVSESCLRLIGKIQLLRTLDVMRLKSYICTTVRNTAITYLTRTNRSEIALDLFSDEVQLLADSEDLIGQLILQSELDQVWAAIGQLPEQEQHIMRLKYDLDLSIREIAEQTGISPGSVTKHITRARNHLKTRLYAPEKGGD